MADRTSQLLNLFQQSFSQGVGLGERSMERQRQQANQERQFQAQQQAEQFRQQLATGQEGRAAQKFQMDMGELARQQRTRLTEDQERQLNQAVLAGQLSGAEAQRIKGQYESQLAQEGMTEEAVAQRAQSRALDVRGKRAQVVSQEMSNRLSKLKETQTKKLLDQAAAPSQDYRIGFTREQISQNPRAVEEAIEAANQEHMRRFGKPMPDYKNLVQDGARLLETSEQEKMFMDLMGEIAKVSGAEAPKTLVGSIPLLGRLWPEARKDAALLDRTKAQLSMMVSSLRQSEPNSQAEQKLQQQLTKISALDTDEQIQEAAQLISSILKVRAKNAGGFLKLRGIMSTKPEAALPSRSGGSPASSNLPFQGATPLGGNFGRGL